MVGSGEQSPEIKTNLRTFGEQGNLSFIGLGELPSDSASKLSQYYRWFCTLGERTIRWLSSQRIKPSYANSLSWLYSICNPVAQMVP